MDLEGAFQVAVDWDGSRVRSTQVHSTRSDFAQTLLAGRRAHDARAVLPRVFSVCAWAQATAIAAALDAAQGIEEHDARQREVAVRAEAALEYLWRLQIDLPALLGLPQQPHALAQLRSDLGRAGGAASNWPSFIGALRTALEGEGLGPGGGFEPTDPAGFDNWATRSQARAARLLRAVRAAPLRPGGTALLAGTTTALLRKISAALASGPGFSRRPEYDGAPAECGARARLDQHALLDAVGAGTSRAYQRVLARAIELQETPERLMRLLDGEATQPWIRSVALAPGHGIAGVETARGLLVHEVTLAGDRIASYRLVAPTEWNFHPDGALAADLDGVPAHTAREVRRLASLAIQSLDPCVRFDVRVAHA